jgi:hypothetical protein
MSILLPHPSPANAGSIAPAPKKVRLPKRARRVKPSHKSWDSWPAEETEELDGDRWEPTVAAPYEVRAASGNVLDRYADKFDAIAALHRWPSAVLVTYRGIVVARREMEAAAAGEIARAA